MQDARNTPASPHNSSTHTPLTHTPPHTQVPSGTMKKAVILETKYPTQRKNGSHFHYLRNTCALLSEKGTPVGNRVRSMLSYEFLKPRCVACVSCERRLCAGSGSLLMHLDYLHSLMRMASDCTLTGGRGSACWGSGCIRGWVRLRLTSCRLALSTLAIVIRQLSTRASIR